MSRFFKILLPLLLLLVGTGCGRSSVRPPASFSGAVTLDGQPLDAGSIQFTSLESGETAYANLDELGHFKVDFPEADLGTDYDVTVGQPIRELDAIDALSAGKSKAVSKVPGRYANRGTSKLTAKLAQAGENVVNFDLATNAK